MAVPQKRTWSRSPVPDEWERWKKTQDKLKRESEENLVMFHRPSWASDENQARTYHLNDNNSNRVAALEESVAELKRQINELQQLVLKMRTELNDTAAHVQENGSEKEEAEAINAEVQRNVNIGTRAELRSINERLERAEKKLALGAPSSSDRKKPGPKKKDYLRELGLR